MHTYNINLPLLLSMNDYEAINSAQRWRNRNEVVVYNDEEELYYNEED